MTNLDRMIEEFCPDGVKYVELKYISQLLNGYAFEGNRYSNKGIRVIRISDVQKGSISNKDLKFYPEDSIEDIQRYLLEENDLVMSLTGNVGRIAMIAKKHLPAALNQRVVRIKVNEEEVSNRFLFHFLDQDSFENIAMRNSTGGGQKNLSTKWLGNFPIPLPPLPVQQEIVRILDNFTHLTAELTAELTARRKQYEYCRNSLLNFDNGIKITPQKQVKWATLGEIAMKVSSGGTPNTGNSSYYGGTIPWLRTQEIDWTDIYDTSVKITEEGLNNSSANWIPKNCVIVAMYGATAAKVAINKIPLTTNQACCNIQIDRTQALYRYVFHWLSNEYEILKAKGRGSQSNINAKIIRNHPIPLPPLAEQARIVSILDKFDALVNDLSSGIPAEIEARQKQYEYYRDRLLTFKEKVS